MKLKNILFITSFVPVTIFTVLARVRGATFTQAKIATVIGLILAGIQFMVSKQFLESTTYLDKAFLGFLGFGTAWVYFTPSPLSSLFGDHSATLLYSVLFLTTLLPQLFGYDPFTYAIAKRWYPETVWKVPQFRLINLYITYVWSYLFFFSALSSWLGHGKPVFCVLIPLILLFGIGLPFSRKYPDYYLKRIFTTQPVDPSFFPATAQGSPRPKVSNTDVLLQEFLKGAQSEGAETFLSSRRERPSKNEQLRSNTKKRMKQ